MSTDHPLNIDCGCDRCEDAREVIAGRILNLNLEAIFDDLMGEDDETAQPTEPKR